MSGNLAPEKRVSLLSDAPSERDALGYEDYCDALVSVVEGSTSETPLTVGVFGDWGIGKTTLLRFMKKELDKGEAQTLWVDVWQLANEEDIWAAFLQSLLVKVKKEMSWFKRLLFNVGLMKRRIDYQWLIRKVPELLVRSAIVVVPLYVSLSNLIPREQTPQSSYATVAAGAGTVLSAVLGWYVLLQPYIQAVRRRVKVDLMNAIKVSPLKDRVLALDEFRTYFEDMIKSLVGDEGRLVVFIDDLDRCPPERIVQVLDALKLFLDVPQCVNVIGLDREIIEQAVETKFDGYKDPTGEARRYLEKIISLPFDLPPLSDQQMRTLVNRLDTDLPDQELLTQVFALGQESNPRRVKRAVNSFLLLWTLAQKRWAVRSAITPTRLAKVVMIQQSYHDLYSVLPLSPKALGDLELYFRLSKGPTAGEAGTIPGQGLGEEVPKVPNYLEPFTGNVDLRSLLTLHDGKGKEDKDANFTIWTGAEYEILPEHVINIYIRLTRSISYDETAVRGADLRGADLHATNLRVQDLKGADLRGAVLIGANLSSALLNAANLRDADLRHAILRNADLRGANLSNAKLQKAELIAADLSEADLSWSDLRGANLQGTQLTQEQLSQARGDKSTRLPDFVQPPPMWNQENQYQDEKSDLRTEVIEDKKDDREFLYRRLQKFIEDTRRNLVTVDWWVEAPAYDASQARKEYYRAIRRAIEKRIASYLAEDPAGQARRFEPFYHLILQLPEGVEPFVVLKDKVYAEHLARCVELQEGRGNIIRVDRAEPFTKDTFMIIDDLYLVQSKLTSEGGLHTHGVTIYTDPDLEFIGRYKRMISTLKLRRISREDL